jgi:HlyD family secretion protein
MNNRRLTSIALVGLLALGLAACGTQANAGGAATSTATLASPTAAPTAGIPTQGGAPTTQPAANLNTGVSGIGIVKPAQDANLTFAVQGTVDKVLVKEGDVVKQGQLLAILDVRSFDQQVESAQAALEIAQAQAAALTEPPRTADVRAAQAQVRQAQIAVAQAGASQTQGVRSAQAGVGSAQSSLQNTRDKLAAAKAQAESQLRSATEGLMQAQASYSQARDNWQRAQDTGKDPITPSKGKDSSGKDIPNKLNDAQRQSYYTAYVQAESALQQAEQSIQQAQVAYDNARQAEVTGIQVAEQQVTQAQAGLETQNLPAGSDQVASAQASLDLARANLAKLSPAPKKSDEAQAQARIKQAQSALDSARLSRERAELHAPFDGIVDSINIDPGDPSAPAGVVPIYMLDVGALHVDVDINDVDIGKVKLDQPVTLDADSMTGTRYTGRVTFIASSATVAGNARTYVVRIALDKQAGLRPGMRVRASIGEH